MAKYCGQCGFKADDDAKVCGRCGAFFDGPGSAPVPASSNKLKKIFKIVIPLMILTIVAVVAANIVFSFIGSKGLVRKVMKAYRDYDIHTLISLSSDMYYYGEEEVAEQYFEDSVGTDQDEFEDLVGHSYKLSYEVNEIYDLSERRLDEALDVIELGYPEFDVSVIEKISIANLAVTAKQGKKSIKREINIWMTKEGDAWKLLYIE